MRFRRRAVVDVDGVLADFGGAYQQRLVDTCRQMGVEPPYAPIDIWDWDMKYPAHVRKTAWESLTPSWWVQLRPLINLHALNDMFKERDIYPVFATHRSFDRAEEVTRAWLLSQGIDAPTVLSVENKGLLATSFKDCAFLIDDSPDVVMDARRLLHARIGVALVDAPYNQKINHPYIDRVRSVEQALELYVV